MEMTKERLKDYRSKKDEIIELKYKLANLGAGDSMIGNSVVFDYSTGFPRPQSVVGYDQEKHDRQQARYQGLIKKLKEECEEIEKWIDSIPNSLTRRIFRLSFIDGLSQRKVGKKVHVTQSVVSEKISCYLKSDKNDQKV